jgi:hypothetical protein
MGLIRTVEKRMDEQEFCHTCKQRNDCRKVYRKLGNTESPPVVAKVILAFLLPLLVFIVSLGISEKMLTRAIHSDSILSTISILLALFLTFACILLTWMIRRGYSQDR